VFFCFLQSLAAGRGSRGNGIAAHEHLSGACASRVFGIGVGPGLHQQAYILLLLVHAGQHERGEPIGVHGIDLSASFQQVLHGGGVIAFHGSMQGILYKGLCAGGEQNEREKEAFHGGERNKHRRWWAAVLV
jgi:hypothetical protein